MDTYLRTRAGQDMRRGSCIVYLLVDRPDGRVAGYYTLSAHSIDLNDLPSTMAKRLPRYPVVSATLLGRIALDLSYQGEGLGRALLFDALKRAYEASLTIGSSLVVVDLLNEHVRGFYLAHDFVPLPGNPNRLVLPMATVAKAIGPLPSPTPTPFSPPR